MRTKGCVMMNVDSIGSATLWSTGQTSAVNTKTDIADALVKAKEATKDGSGQAPAEEPLTTKITTNADGERIVVFMRGDEVVKTMKAGSFEDLLGGGQGGGGVGQKYVDNGSADIGSMLSLGG